MSGSLYRCRPLVLSCVLVFWALCLIDGTPATSVVHQELDRFVDPVLIRTSLWQNDWALFAPNIDHYNSKIECVITWEDGTKSVWTHPDWTDASCWLRFREFRRMEYYDSVVLEFGKQAWPAFANWTVAEMAAETGKTPRLAELVYYGDTIASPEEMWRKAYTAPQFDSHMKFFTWYPNAVSESEIHMFGN